MEMPIYHKAGYDYQMSATNWLYDKLTSNKSHECPHDFQKWTVNYEMNTAIK